jgi:copper ion binding protein
VIEREYAVAGMHCESCVALVTEEVGDVDGVEAVSVDLAGGRATVRFDPARVDDARIVEAIRAAGYEATAL